VFFEGCEDNAVGEAERRPHRAVRETAAGRRERTVETSEVMPVPGAIAWEPARGESRRGGNRTTRAEQDGSGGTDSPKGGKLPGSGRAPETSARHPANEPSASETRRHERRRLGSSRFASREGRTWPQAGAAETSPVQPTGGRAAMRVVSPADPPGAARQRVDDRPGRFACPARERSRRRSRFRHLGGGISTTGGACASTARWRRAWT
jgi:hypothetical protein